MVAPEVRELCWLPLADAIFLALSTMVAGGTLHHVNDWQKDEFERLGIKQRDPMYMTAVSLMEASMLAERERLQWLFPGMTDEDVRAGGLNGKGEPKDMLK